MWLCLAQLVPSGLNPHPRLCFDHHTAVFLTPLGTNTFYFSIPVLSKSILKRYPLQRYLEQHRENLVVHTEVYLIFSLCAVQTLQCYSCPELTAVEDCVAIRNCTEDETMCKTTMYSLEDGKNNYFFIRIFNLSQCFYSEDFRCGE